VASSSTLAPDAPITAPAPPPARPAGRWPALDAFRGLALCMMIVHHLAEWTGGRARHRIVGFEGFAVTDLAAPAFALGAGAAAFLVGQQIRAAGAPWSSLSWRRARRALRRYGEVLALGLAIDIAVGGGIDGGGVLPTLAALGALVTLGSLAGLVHPAAWWGIAAVCAVTAIPVTSANPEGLVAQLWAGSFSIVVYGVFAAAGAALAAGARGRGEGALPLLPAATAVLVFGGVVAWVAPAQTAPDGLWPPARHPGGLAFTTWGLAGSLVLWAVVRVVVPRLGRVGAGLTRAGRRTLLVFGLHYLVKLALQHGGWQGELDTWRWGLVTWGAGLVACLLATVPPSRRRPARATA